MLPAAYCSLLRRVITFARPNLRIFHAAKLHGDFAELAVARFVCRIVAEAVLRANLVGDLREGRARVLQRGRREILAA